MRRGQSSGPGLALLALAAGLAGAPGDVLGAEPLRADCPGLAGATIRWIVPSRPGGGYDAYSRLLQPFLERDLSARIVIENRPEAGGIVGALAIRDAAPDGRTLGIINASGLLAARAGHAGRAPDPAGDFTILASIVSNHVVLFSGRDSGIADVDDLLRGAQARPIVAGVRDAGSSSFYALPIVASLLGFEYQLVTGYVGSAARTLAAMRGEVDVVVGHFDSVQGPVRDGELVPLLQLTAAPMSGAGSDLDLPRLAGPDGLARQRAAATGRSPEQAVEEAAALAALVGAGRLVVAPRELPQALAACLDATLGAILDSAELQAAAERAQLGVEPRNGREAQAEVAAGARALLYFDALIRAAVEQARR
jgi:tripartite-type tricarboxylate transporter receptor subunit TctC